MTEEVGGLDRPGPPDPHHPEGAGSSRRAAPAHRFPPKPVRRLTLVPLGLVVCVALVVTAPVLFLGAAVVDLFSDRRMPRLRLVALAVTWALFDVLGLLALLGLWLVSGFGLRMGSKRIQEAHYALMRFWLGGVSWAAGRLFRLEIRIEDPPERQAGPVLVFSRHAGPGNSLMLLAVLMRGYRRRPRIVMLEKLQLEPFFDVIGNRLPNRFIRHDPARRDRSLEEIAELAAGTGDGDAFVLFPEGKDFTPGLRLRAIASLRRRGHEAEARKAERMERVLPPRTAGVAAALRAAPGADVVFVAHTVLEDVGSFWDLRHRGPLERPVLARYWRIPSAEVPTGDDALVEWLYDWWARIDAWIDARVDAAGRPAAAAVEVPSALAAGAPSEAALDGPAPGAETPLGAAADAPADAPGDGRAPDPVATPVEAPANAVGDVRSGAAEDAPADVRADAGTETRGS